MHFENILIHLGFGKFHYMLFILIGLLQIFGGINTSSKKFVFPSFIKPSTSFGNYRCYVPNCDNPNSTYADVSWLNFSIPSHDGQLSSCLYYAPVDEDSPCSASNFTNTTLQCDRWVFDKTDFESTAVESFDLICKKKNKKTISDSIFMAGNMAGALLFGRVSDRYGRKIVFPLAVLLMLPTSIGTAFSPNLQLFNFLRFVTSACVSGLFITGYVLAFEFIGGSKRLWFANILQMVFAFGEFLLAILAYFITDWKTLQLVISIPTCFMLLYYWILPESVRWQITRGEHEKALNTIQRAARWNKVEIPSHLLTQEPEEDTPLLGSGSNTTKPPGILNVFKSPALRRNSINLMYNWFVNSVVYYGVSMNAANLVGNIYFNFAILSLVEIPFIIMATFAIQKMGRKPALATLLVFSGMACTTSSFIPKHLHWMATTLAVLGKGAIAGSFATVYVYTGEIYPTVLRNTGIGLSSAASKLGSIISPFILLLSKFYKPLPMIIFGAFAIIAGVATLDLPETHNKQLPETLEEAENFRRRRDDQLSPLIGYASI